MSGIGGGQGGGSIISRFHVLTAAFVLTPNWDVVHLYYGGTTRSTQKNATIFQRILHPGYNGNPRINDIGVAIIESGLEFNRMVQAIALPSLDSILPHKNEQGIALGFSGHPVAISEHLQAAFLRVVSEERCTSRFPGHQTNHQFCAEDVRLRSDICPDDVSGPFIVSERGEDILVGIASVSFCQPNIDSQPSLFTRVSAFRFWIHQVTSI